MIYMKKNHECCGLKCRAKIIWKKPKSMDVRKNEKYNIAMIKSRRKHTSKQQNYVATPDLFLEPHTP